MKVLVCASAGAGIFGWFIRKVTRSFVNHVFILYESEFWGGWFAIEIAEKGPVPIPAYKALKGCDKLYVFEPKYDLREGIIKNKNRINVGYDWLGIIGFFLAYIRSWFTGEVVKNKLHSSGRDFCSEYVSSVIRDSSGSNSNNLIPESTSPKDLELMLSMKDNLYKSIRFKELKDMDVPVTKKLIKSWNK